MEFQRRFNPGMSLEEVIASLASFQTDAEQEFTLMINDKHAPIMIPRVTIDSAHNVLQLTAANSVAILAQLVLTNTAASTSATIQTAVSYTGRGILTKCIIGEFSGVGTVAYNAELKITIDGNVVYDVANAITRQQQIRVVVGNLIDIQADAQLAVTDGYPGLPFNNSCLIEYKSDGTRNTTVGWKIAKKY